MKFELEPYHRNVSDEDLIEDLKSVAKKIEKVKVTIREYDLYGKFRSTTLMTRFGSWNNTLEKAKLELSHKINISNEELLENLEEVWIKLGRQPGRRDMIKPISKFSEGPYINKFGFMEKGIGRIC